MASPWHCAEAGKGHYSCHDIKASDRYCPLHGSNEWLELLHLVLSEERRVIHFQMIVLFKWRWSFPGFLPMKLNIGIYHLVNIAFCRDLHLPIIIPRERLTKMKINRIGSLQLEVILLLKSIREWFRVQHSKAKVVNIRGHILIQIAIESYPDIRFCLARWKTFIAETIGKAFMPT